MKVDAKTLSQLAWDNIEIGMVVMVPTSSVSKVVAEVVGLNEKDKTIEIKWEGLLGVHHTSVKHREADLIEVC